MGLFKKFTDGVAAHKASRSELESFKALLKYGDDPKELYDKSRHHYKEYRKHRELTEKLLRKILQPKESNVRDNWSKMEINVWHHRGKCKESPVGEHVYLNHYGEDNPKRGIQECLCCGREL